MSFILDALRKSENARQRHSGPTFAEVPVGRRKEGRPWWVTAVAVLLLVNLAVLLFVLLRPADVTPDASTAITAAPATPAPADPSPPSVSSSPSPGPAAQTPASSVRTLAEEASTTSPLDIDGPTASSATAAAVPERSPIVRPLTPSSAGAVGNASSEADENLPTVNEITGDRAANIPAMHLDIHVHSPNATERFVFINMKRYNEGDTLTEGPVLERITPEGVILNQRGFRFILPRQ